MAPQAKAIYLPILFEFEKSLQKKLFHVVYKTHLLNMKRVVKLSLKLFSFFKCFFVIKTAIETIKQKKLFVLMSLI